MGKFYISIFTARNAKYHIEGLPHQPLSHYTHLFNNKIKGSNKPMRSYLISQNKDIRVKVWSNNLQSDFLEGSHEKR
jgi:hypothetical protein